MKTLLAGAVAVLALVTACTSEAESADPTTTTTTTSEVAPTPCDVLGSELRTAPEAVDGYDVIIFLEPGASEESRAAVETAIEEHGDTVQIDYVDEAATLAEFREMFEGDPWFESIRADDLPTSYRLRLGDAEAFSPSAFESIHGVREVVRFGEAGAQQATVASAILTQARRLSDLAVFLESHATEEDIEQIQEMLAPDVIDVWIVDDDETFEEFQLIFADRPHIIETVDAQVLPRSIRATLTVPIDPEQYSSLPGVRQAVRHVWSDWAVAEVLSDPALRTELTGLDGQLGRAAESLLDFHRRRLAAGSARTLGAVFSPDELESSAAAGRQLATFAAEECGLGLGVED